MELRSVSLDFFFENPIQVCIAAWQLTTVEVFAICMKWNKIIFHLRHLLFPFLDVLNIIAAVKMTLYSNINRFKEELSTGCHPFDFIIKCGHRVS